MFSSLRRDCRPQQDLNLWHLDYHANNLPNELPRLPDIRTPTLHSLLMQDIANPLVNIIVIDCSSSDEHALPRWAPSLICPAILWEMCSTNLDASIVGLGRVLEYPGIRPCNATTRVVYPFPGTCHLQTYFRNSCFLTQDVPTLLKLISVSQMLHFLFFYSLLQRKSWRLPDCWLSCWLNEKWKTTELISI